MVETRLTDTLIDEGKRLVEALDKRGTSPLAAFWMLFPDIAGWKLLLSEVKSPDPGPRALYEIIQAALRTLNPKPTQLTLEDVAAAKPDSPIVELLGTAIRTGPGISGIRFTRNVINGVLIPDAYIYRVTKRPRKAAP